MSRSAVELVQSIAAPVVWGTSEKRIFYMEKMPARPGRDTDAVVTTVSVATAARSGWRTGLPTLSGSMTTLRELRLSDAPALFESLTMDAVARFISPPPSSVEGFERFIAWTLRQRVAGQ
jgi:RimJ/RimL family protein N-acetyltransferase